MADAMGYVVDAMKNEAPIQDKLLCVSRLRVVALALGEEKTRSEMLPFLRKLRDPPVRWPGTRGEAPLETADAGSPRRRRLAPSGHGRRHQHTLSCHGSGGGVISYTPGASLCTRCARAGA